MINNHSKKQTSVCVCVCVCVCSTVERELKMKTSKSVTIERNLYPRTQSRSNEPLKKRAEAAV